MVCPLDRSTHEHDAEDIELRPAEPLAGLRGATHALRENLRADGIAVTCLSPGNIGTITIEHGIKSASAHESREMIPPRDLIAIIKCVIGLSNATCVKEIDVMGMTDRV